MRGIFTGIGKVVVGLLSWVAVVVLVLGILTSIVSLGTVVLGAIVVIVLIGLIVGGVRRLFGMKPPVLTVKKGEPNHYER